MYLIKAADLQTYLTRSPTASRGCLVDTNILLAANFSLDHFHESAIGIFETLIEERVPRFANVNVRSEFIHISRKIVIAPA
jgi:predicted nucleic acid-binding protein